MRPAGREGPRRVKEGVWERVYREVVDGRRRRRGEGLQEVKRWWEDLYEAVGEINA